MDVILFNITVQFRTVDVKYMPSTFPNKAYAGR